jgi:hypothetical protein
MCTHSMYSNTATRSSQGSGLGGRVTELDVLRAAGKAPAEAPSAVKASRVAPTLPDGPVKLTGMQVCMCVCAYMNIHAY